MAPLSPVEQKQAYLNLQAGGEAPLQGFRKPAPEKPKGMFFTEIAMLWRAAKFCFEFFFSYRLQMSATQFSNLTILFCGENSNSNRFENNNNVTGEWLWMLWTSFDAKLKFCWLSLTPFASDAPMEFPIRQRSG